jgi:hypothetical protein
MAACCRKPLRPDRSTKIVCVNSHYEAILQTQQIDMTILQKTFVIVTMFAAVGMVFYEANQAATLRSQVLTLQRQQASSSAQNRQLLRERFIGERIDDPKAATIAGIMADPNFRVVIHALEQRNSFEDLAEPKVITTSGRQIQGRYVWFDTPAFPVATNSPSSTSQRQAQ